MIHTEVSFVLNSDPALIPSVVAHLQDLLVEASFGDEGGRKQVAMALHEALQNALYHGNLELSSELGQDRAEEFWQLAEARRLRPPFCDRRIYVSARLSSEEAVFVIRDDGYGFDVSQLPDPTDPDNVGKSSGRGVLLIRSFMDEVSYSPPGNQITMIKRNQKSPEEDACGY